MFTAVLLGALALGGALLVRAGSERGAEGTGDVVVAASFYPMYIAAWNVAGDVPGVTVENMAQPSAGCLHDYQLTPSDLILLSGADIFVVNGGGIENFLEDVAEQYPSLEIVTASQGIELLETEPGTVFLTEEGGAGQETDGAEQEADEAGLEAGSGEGGQAAGHVHVHGDENAHVWMDIARYMQEVENIRDGLSEADPAHQAFYEANAAAYLEKLERLRLEMESVKEKAGNEKVMIFHEAFAYLGEALGLDVRGAVNMDENASLSANMVSEIIDRIHREGITMLLAEEQYGAQIADAVARETGASVYMLDALLDGEEDADSYLEGMDRNIHVLEEAFGE